MKERAASASWVRRGVTTAALAGLTLAGAVAPASADVEEPRAQNVILLQGDGMGTAHRAFFRLATVGNAATLAMDSLRYSGSVHTDPDDPTETVSDSAAGATAFATGVKTFNGAVGVDADGTPVQSLLERAGEAGKATGLVTTAQVTDATPAAFAAHVTDRYQQSEIARQYLHGAQPDVLLGGGEDWWYPEGEPGAWPDNPEIDPEEESQGTHGNLVEEAQSLGYEYVTDREELRASTGDKLLGLFANEEMFHAANEGEGGVYEPEVPLPEMAAKALDILSADPDGFFLVLEEEGIDEMAHNNNAELTLEAGRDLDETVTVVMDFVADNPDTLVLVVGDHATGGLSIENVDPEDESGEGASAEDGPFTVYGTDLQFTIDWTTTGHTGDPTPVTAEGPGAAALGRVLENVDVHDAVLQAMFGDDEPEEPTEPPTGQQVGFFLNDGWDAWADHAFQYGRLSDEVLVGDWDDNATDTITIRRGNEFHVSNAQTGGNAEEAFTYGRAGDVILVGDWDGDGTDTLAVRRGKEYHIKNSITGGGADVVIRYGRAGDEVVVGDFDADGADTLAVRRGKEYHVKNSLTPGEADEVISYGKADDVVLAGDWDGDGDDTFAVRRGNVYHVKNTIAGGEPDLVQSYGRAGDEVYVGDWNGDATDTLGVRRTS